MTPQEAHRKLQPLQKRIAANNRRAEQCFAQDHLLDMAAALEENGDLLAEAFALGRIMLGLPLPN